MAVLSAQTMALAASGQTLTWNSCGASGDLFVNAGKAFVIVKTGATASPTVTFAVTQSVTDASLVVPDLTVSCSTSEETMIGPLPTATFNNGSSQVAMTYTNSSTMTVAVVIHP